MATTARRARLTESSHAVRTDAIVAASLIALATLGRLLWQASDSGFFDTFGAR